MIAGTRFDVNDEKFKHLLFLLQRRFRSGNVTGGLVSLFPKLAKLFPTLSGQKELDETSSAINKFLKVSPPLSIKNKIRIRHTLHLTFITGNILRA